MERSAIRDLPAPEMKTRIAPRSIRATLAHGDCGRILAAFAGSRRAAGEFFQDAGRVLKRTARSRTATAMTDVDKKETWFAYAQKLHDLGVMTAKRTDRERARRRRPQVIALTLLCRTMSHVEGVVAMIDRGLIVEVRTLTRCCYESLIWIDGLAKESVEFVKKITDNDYAYKKLRGKVLLEWAAKQDTKPAFEEKLQACLEEIKTTQPKAKPISFKTTADAGVHL